MKKIISTDRSLERKLNALAVKVARIDAIADFLTKHPGMSKHCTLKQMSTGTGLYFEDQAYIRPVGAPPVALQLERHIEGWDSPEADDRIIHPDVSKLTARQLAAVFKEANIDPDREDAED